MKYLKVFETFDKSSMVEDIKDICLELVDIGFEVPVYIPEGDWKDQSKDGLILIGKIDDDKEQEYFNWSDVSEVIERLKEYLGDRIENVMVTSLDNLDGSFFYWNYLLSDNEKWYSKDVYIVKIEFSL